MHSFPCISACRFRFQTLLIVGIMLAADASGLGNDQSWDERFYVLFRQGRGVARALVIDNTGRLYMGGEFTKAGGESSPRIALWHIAPSLQMSMLGAAAVLSWSAPTGAFVLEQTGELSPESSWNRVDAEVESMDGILQVVQPIASGIQFYRLRRVDQDAR